MKWRLLVIASVLLNAVLVAAYLTNRRPEVSGTTEVVVRTNTLRKADQARTIRPLTVEISTNAFHWGEVESPDYREYIANLRAINCPEETIRDIVIADVNKLFASRIAGLYPSPKDFKFWRVENRAAREEDRGREQKRRELEREKRALIKELLGIDYENEMARLSGRPDEDDWRFGFLTAEKQELLRTLQTKYREMERALMAEGGFRNPENRAKMTALRAQREAELAQALGAQDYQEYQLRNSPTARNMRDSLASFEPTEDEFRHIFDIRKQFEDQFGFIRDGGDQAMREQRQAAQAKVDEQLRALLGEERYHDYALAQDDRFREIYDFTERNNLPRSTADALLEIRKTVEQTGQEIRNNPALSPEEQRLAMLKVREETLATVKGTLGDSADAYLNDRDNRWLTRMVPPENGNNNNAAQRGVGPRGFEGRGGGFGPGGYNRPERRGRP